MNSEILQTLLQWSVVGVLIVLVLRYGFDFRIPSLLRRRNGHIDDPQEVRDPVCGMDIQRDAAAANARHRGRTYYFCSTSCRERFEQDPAEFAQEPARRRGCC